MMKGSSSSDTFFSIIIPVYNSEKYLDACIKSILAQEFQQFEIVVVDDGSTDSSKQIVTKYDDYRVKLFSKENGGVGSARNYGIDVSNGKYLIFLDSDDLLAEHALLDAYNAICSEKDVFICNGYIELSDKSRYENILFPTETFEQGLTVKETKILCQNLSSMCIGIYRREYIVTKNLKVREDITCAEDTDFFFKALAASEKAEIIKCTLFAYRCNTSSVTHNLSYKSIKSVLLVCSSRMKDLLENPIEDIDIKKGLNFFATKYIHFCIKTARLSGNERKELLELIKKDMDLLRHAKGFADKAFRFALLIIGANFAVILFDNLIKLRNFLTSN